MPTIAPTSTSATGNAASILPPGFEAAYAAANPADGQTVFNTQLTTMNGVWMCSQCHSVTPDEARLIGPGLYNIAVRGETRREGMDTLSYIYNSITHPSEFLVPGEPPYPDGLMPQNYAEVLTEEQLASLIAYLFTLQG
jgi:mono/diheme cytochrome c family protein